jgi:DNA-binding transcriptional ArsR family regulator
MRPLSHPDLQEVSLPAVLHALSDPVRLALVRNLAGGAAPSCQAACRDALPKSTLAHHFRILREAGLVQGRREGRAMVNTLRRAELEARFPGLLDAVLAAAERPCPLSETRA